MRLYCAGCANVVTARLTNGEEIYPHRLDLLDVPFWKCDACGCYVGCHHKTSTPHKPLGCIPSSELREARKHIHRLLDPIWMSGKISRNAIYRRLSDELGWRFHTAQIRSVDEARNVYRLIQKIGKELYK